MAAEDLAPAQGISATRGFALAISRLGHPLVFIMATTAIVLIKEVSPEKALPVLGTLFLVIILPTALLLVAGVRSGRWHDADVSQPKERKQFYPRAIPISALGVAAMWLVNAPRFVLRGGCVTLAVFILAALINRRMKISLHAIFASLCVAILFRIGMVYGMVGLVVALLVFWSRLFLGRHNISEIVAGIALGTAGGLVAAWLPEA